jgi:hypothetical protein
MSVFVMLFENDPVPSGHVLCDMSVVYIKKLDIFVT